MKNFKEKIATSFAVLVLLTMAFVIFTGIEKAPSVTSTAKSELKITAVITTDDIIHSLFFDTPVNVKFTPYDFVEYYEINYPKYQLLVVHHLAVPYQKESWNINCIDIEGNILNTKYVTEDTEHMIRAMCIKIKDKNQHNE